MWTARIEANAARMRNRKPGDLAEARLRGLEKARRGRLAKGDVHRSALIEVQMKLPVKRLRRIANETRAPYPNCPHCNSSDVIRRGLARGIQRYQCVECRRTYSGGKVIIRAEEVPMLCYRCGSRDVQPLARALKGGGREGRCKGCNRKFTQGGREDLERYRLLLEQRVADAGLPAEVRTEVLQLASLAVIEGRGYCWNIELNIKESWRNVRGDYKQAGSDHPMYRLHNGQAMFDA